jgi:hypothetical protein
MPGANHFNNFPEFTGSVPFMRNTLNCIGVNLDSHCFSRAAAEGLKAAHQETELLILLFSERSAQL